MPALSLPVPFAIVAIVGLGFLKMRSPHQSVLVIAANKRLFDYWLRSHGLSSKDYRYIFKADDLRERRWETHYLILIEGWGNNPMFALNVAYAWQILDANFPGWHPHEVIWGDVKTYS